MKSPLPTIERAVSQVLVRCGLDASDAPVVVAVSGGVDSVVAAHAVQALGYDTIMVHVHHGLRGPAADRDADLVSNLAEEWGCRVHVCHIGDELAASKTRKSMQDRARTLRYERIEQAARESGAAAVITGHHRDDQAETVLLQLLRGTGPEGLSGMAVDRAIAQNSSIRLIRPLLEISRDDILQYASDRQLRWHEDQSNRSTDYRRNAIRHQVLPVLDRIVEGASGDRIVRAANLVRAYVGSDLDGLTEALMVGGGRSLPGGGGLLMSEVLEPLPDVWRGRLVLRCMKRWLPSAPRDRLVTGRILGLLPLQTGRRIPVRGGAVWREREGVAFVPDRPIPDPVELRVGEPVGWDGMTFRLDTAVTSVWPSDQEAVVLDGDRLPDSLTVRPWRPGDRLYPPGMDGSRKVKDMLTDARIPAHAKLRSPVVVAGSRVVWLVGVRADRHFVPTPGCDVRMVLRATRSG